MESFRAVAIFPDIKQSNYDQFCLIARRLLAEIQKQDSIIRYDLFFSEDKSRCVVLEEYSNPEALVEHVAKNGDLLEQLQALGGKIEGSVFPMQQEGELLNDIRNSWDSEFHEHFGGKVL